MTSPPRTVDSSPTPSSTKKKSGALLVAVIFAGTLLAHLPLLNLPYYWDEAGYFIPAARDLLLTGDLIPVRTLSNAHPPLVPAYLALCWKLFGEGIIVTRVAMIIVAALTLLGVFRLARHVANREVAIGTTICTALYPVFFAQSSLAHLDMAVAALTIWGLIYYLPERDAEADAPRSMMMIAPPPPAWTRWAVCLTLFGLAALAKETAILTPLALGGWSAIGWCWRGVRERRFSKSYLMETRGEVVKILALLLPLVPLALWLAYHYQRTGYVFGNPEFFRYNVEATLTPERVLFAGGNRLWHVTGHMNLFMLSLATVLAMLRPPVKDASDSGGGARRRIDVSTQVVFGVLVAVHVVALSLIGGAVLARYMLPVLPLVILVFVSTVWRRAIRWRQVLGGVCAAFVLAMFVNPPHRYPWEENLAYRDFILLHREAARFIAERHPDARVLTTWPGTDELREPYFGYTSRPLAVESIPHFSKENLAAANAGGAPFDLVFLFSTNFHDDLSPDAAASLFGAEIIFREERRGQWVAVLKNKK